MNEQSFLDRIATSPGDVTVLREYARWLRSNEDPRAAYLEAELDLLDTQARFEQLQCQIADLTLNQKSDTAWMDQILPLVIRAPVAGVYYDSPAPDEEPFVKPSDICDARTKIGFVESRKVFYPIEAGRPGMVCEQFVSNGEAVTLDTPLVRLIRPPRLGPIR